MKKTGVCPKCGGDILKTGLRAGHSAIVRVGLFFGATTNVYICLTCGYCEEYVVEHHLQKLQTRDDRV